jgi:DNA polymerase III subunit gamma/tau
VADQPTPSELDLTPADPTAAGPLASDDPQYHSLYRRFRPQRFSEVRGQEHVTRALRNAVREGRVAHAYLFSGPRGTGKTSTARILSMALNCTNLQDGEPCGVCESCVEIRRGASVDVHELDAASNRKLDEMRDLLSRVALGTPGRSKVYIIDEVHQLTGDSASALLKTLEEPPGHVVFVLATTDPQKVLPTIRSRTLHFEFHLLASDVLGELLRTVNNQAGLGVAPEAIDLVVRRGHGSARDALTVLDQVAAAGEVEDEATVVAEIVDGLAERDPGRVLLAVAEGMASGRDARRLAADILDRLRNGFLATMARGLVMLPDDGVASVAEQARRLGPAALVRAMEGIGEALTAMRDSVDPRVTLEVALVRQARPDVDHSPAALLERVERLERAVAKSGTGHPPPAEPPPGPNMGEVEPSAPSRDPALRSALGAHRQPAAAPQPPQVPDSVPRSGAAPAPGPAPVPVTPAASAQVPKPPEPPASVPAPAAVPAQEPPPPAGGPSAPLPSRDELTKAWGDGVLRGLPGKARSRFASGRFLAVSDGAAVFAVPDKHLLGRCEETRADAEAALAARFGRPVPLRLVLDPGGAPQDGTGPGSSSADDPPGRSDPTGPTSPAGSSGPVTPSDLEDVTFEYSTQEVADLEDAGPAITSPEQRLLEAFPGAEEVSQ